MLPLIFAVAPWLKNKTAENYWQKKARTSKIEVRAQTVEKPILYNGRVWETKSFPSGIRRMSFAHPRKIVLHPEDNRAAEPFPHQGKCFDPF